MIKNTYNFASGFLAMLSLAGWLLLSSAAVSGCNTTNSSNKKEGPREASALYENYCASCHGMYMERFAGDDRQAMFAMPQARMEQIIKNGVLDAGMPAFADAFSDEETSSLAQYILTDIREDASTHEYRPGFRQVVQTEKLAFTIDTVATGLNIPWGMTWLPNGDMLVSERSGELFRFRDGKLAAIIENVPPVFARGQGGLLDITVHPNYQENGWLYIAYSEPTQNGKEGNTAIMRAHLNNDKLNDKEQIFKAEPNSSRGVHFGCQMVFDDKGYLFFGVGDRGNRPNAQDLTNHSGKIHRIYDDGRIPPDNPFVTTEGARQTIWSYGHRNPQGLVFQESTGVLWETEHGPKGGDELNIIERGLNYGWPEITYGINYNGTIITRDTAKAGMEQPVIYWTPSIAPCGMALADAEVYPEWANSVFSGSLSFRYVVRTQLDGRKVKNHEIMLREAGRVRSIETGPDGYLYIGVENPGLIFRLIPERGGES